MGSGDEHHDVLPGDRPTNRWKAPEYDLTPLARGKERVRIRVGLTNTAEGDVTALDLVALGGVVE